MNPEEVFLLRLIRLALFGGNHDVVVDGNVDWREVCRLAHEQTVMGIVASTVGKLPEDRMPDEKIRMMLINCALRIEQANMNQCQFIGRLFQHLKDMGLKPFLIKGQALGRNYPDYRLRQCGDVDVYFYGRKDGMRAVEWARTIDSAAAGCKENNMNTRHYAFKMDNEDVELHYMLCAFDSKRLNRRLQAIVDNEMEIGTARQMEIDGKRIDILPVTLSMLHQIIHISRHLLTAGVSLRQMCDMALFLDRYANRGLDKYRLYCYLYELELANMASGIGWVLKEHLGLRAECVPFAVNENFGRFLLNEIFTGGNFGTKLLDYKRNNSTLMRKFKSMIFYFRRSVRFGNLLPTEAKAFFLNRFLINYHLLNK